MVVQYFTRNLAFQSSLIKLKKSFSIEVNFGFGWVKVKLDIPYEDFYLPDGSPRSDINFAIVKRVSGRVEEILKNMERGGWERDHLLSIIKLNYSISSPNAQGAIFSFDY